MSKLVDIMHFKLVPGTSVDELLRRARDANGMMKRIPGLLGRRLIGPDPQGVWTEILVMSDEASAQKADEISRQSPNEATPYFALCDKETFTYVRLPVRVECGEP